MIYHSSRRILFVSIPPPLFLENVNSERKLRHLKGSLHFNKSMVFQVHPHVHLNFRTSINKNRLQIVQLPQLRSIAYSLGRSSLTVCLTDVKRKFQKSN